MSWELGEKHFASSKSIPECLSFSAVDLCIWVSDSSAFDFSLSIMFMFKTVDFVSIIRIFAYTRGIFLFL